MESTTLQQLEKVSEEIKILRECSIRTEERMGSMDKKLTEITESIKQVYPRISALELRVQRCETINKLGVFIATSAIAGLIAEHFSK